MNNLKEEEILSNLNSLCDLKGKVAVITGAAGGIGETIAYVLSELGVKIGIIDWSEEGEKVVNKIINNGGEAVFQQADITKVEDVKNSFLEIAKEFRGINFLVNSAGTASKTSFDALSLEEWERIVDINLKGTYICTKIALTYIKKENDGNIVMLSSGSALTGSGGSAAYSASKGAINSLVRALAREYAKDNIRVNAVAPRTIRGRMLKSVYTNEDINEMEKILPLGRLGTERDVANVVIFLLCKLSNYITGETILVDGGRTYCSN